MCEHGRQRSKCKDCGDSGISCEHRRQLSKCKECGGGGNTDAVRARAAARYSCKDARECGGGGICEGAELLRWNSQVAAGREKGSARARGVGTH